MFTVVVKIDETAYTRWRTRARCQPHGRNREQTWRVPFSGAVCARDQGVWVGGGCREGWLSVRSRALFVSRHATPCTGQVRRRALGPRQHHEGRLAHARVVSTFTARDAGRSLGL